MSCKLFRDIIRRPVRLSLTSKLPQANGILTPQDSGRGHCRCLCHHFVNKKVPASHYSTVTYAAHPLRKLNQQNASLGGRNVSFWGSSKVTDWNKAVSEAEKIVGYPTSFMSLRCLLSDELSNVAMQMRKLVGTKHPLLKTARRFFYDGKHSLQTRGLLVLLMSKASGESKNSVSETMVSGIYPSQRNLAEITEMIHTANLIHKGVVNLENLQPSDGPRHDMEFGNKMAVLSGDYLLANASVGLADLQNTEVVEVMSSAIGDLMKAEFSPLRDQDGLPCLPPGGATLDQWEEHAFLSSASLIAKSCRSAVMLAKHGVELQDDAYVFGSHVALAHQIFDEIQPIVKPSDDLPCPSVISAPVILYLCNENVTSSDVTIASSSSQFMKLLESVKKSSAMDEAKELCRYHGQQALKALGNLQESESKIALQNIVTAVTAV